MTALARSAAAPWLTLVGLGEDGLDGLSHAARRALGQAELVVGGRRHLALAGPLDAETLPWSSPIEDTFPAILARRPRPVCVLASGDPFCFGIGSTLARHVPPNQMACHPAPSAFSLAAARLGWGQQDCTLLSLCGRPIDGLLAALVPGAKLLVLSADASTPALVADTLVRSGFGMSRLIVCEAMGGPRERLRSASASDFSLIDVDPLNTIAIELDPDAAARPRVLLPGRPDTWFENDGQLTRAEIRAITLSKLAPRAGEMLWDIGAGSGSVGIEWMLAHPANRAVAVEQKAERAARIRHNAAALGAPGLAVVEGAAPEALAGLPAPQAIFIGGGATGAGVVEACLEALECRGRLVVNSVTIETQALLIGLFKRHGGDLTTIQLAHADPIGGFHGLRPAMGVCQWVWMKGDGESAVRPPHPTFADAKATSPRGRRWPDAVGSDEGDAASFQSGEAREVLAIGVGFRKACSAESLATLVRQALASAAADHPLPVGWTAVLATIAEKDRPPLREAAADLGLDVVLLPKSALRATDDRITITSETAKACLGIPSVAEAAALAAAGPGSRLIVTRIAAADATCAIAVPAGFWPS